MLYVGRQGLLYIHVLLPINVLLPISVWGDRSFSSSPARAPRWQSQWLCGRVNVRLGLFIILAPSLQF